ncbi:hypothetical protein ACFE04_018740 [Oxalis oulophora]
MTTFNQRLSVEEYRRKSWTTYFLVEFINSLFKEKVSSQAGPKSLEGIQAYDHHHQNLISLGAIVNSKSRAGREEKIAMEIAIHDFNSNAYPIIFRPFNVTLHVKNSHGDPLRAASSAKNLIKKNEVKAIVGLGTFQESSLLASLRLPGNKFEVPILSIADEVPTWSYSNLPFLVHAARSQSAQLNAIADIIQTYKWVRVNIIYEDIDSPSFSGLIPFLISKLQQANVEISDLLPLPPFSALYSLSNELKKVKKAHCQVFVVHTSLGLGIQIFKEAKKLGMMEKDSVWITTNTISDYVDTLSKLEIAPMQGVIGIKTYFQSNGARFEDFKTRFRNQFHNNYPNEQNLEPRLYALQAYDAIWSTALALSSGNDSTYGYFLRKILASNFEGFTGNFSFKANTLASARIFRLINVFGESYDEIGFWSMGLGFSIKIGKDNNYNKSMGILGQVLWPGRPLKIPRGWEVSPTGKRLKIGIPSGNTHPEFVKVTYDMQGNLIAEGFSVVVFNATLQFLPYEPFKYDFFAFSGTYDNMVKQIQLEKFDAVVGDTAIIANRYEYADFSQPYSDSGLQVLMYKTPSRFQKAWLFFKPFTSTMWIATAIVNVYNGFAISLIERNFQPAFRGPIHNQIGAWLALSFTTLFSIPGERMHNNLSRLPMVIWLFMALVITSSFTASLTSFLSAQPSDATNIDIEKLKSSGAKVGCDADSFVLNYLEVVFEFKKENIIQVHSEDDYPRLLKNGSIVVAFLEVPYVQMLLAKNCVGFTTAKQIFKVGGFGFAFRKSSPYLSDISEAVLKVSETGKLREIENSLHSSHDCSTSSSFDDGSDDESLGIKSFLGLFLISIGTTTISLFLFIFRQRSQYRYHIFTEEQRQHEPCHDEQFMFGPDIKFINQR